MILNDCYMNLRAGTVYYTMLLRTIQTYPHYYMRTCVLACLYHPIVPMIPKVGMKYTRLCPANLCRNEPADSKLVCLHDKRKDLMASFVGDMRTRFACSVLELSIHECMLCFQLKQVDRCSTFYLCQLTLQQQTRLFPFFLIL